ncbi:RND transporter [Ureibacillus sp. GCM10028918]|uniref:RND transporter n=1 Tax=Ureibacillus sp. GCM10028918 TaxID=3273429 RepID=UPI00361221CC
MKHKDTIKIMNWFVFTGLVCLGVTVGYDGLSSLDHTPMPHDEAYQSRFQLNWGVLQTVTISILLIFTVLLIVGWKRTFPFNVPFALIIAGSLYLYIFMTFTIGWIRLLGMIGFAIAIVAALILMILHTIILWRSKE